MVFQAVSAPNIDINKFGKQIQLDGFLMEWSAQDARVWGKDSTLWYWDAGNSAEGIAGYFRSAAAVKCSTWSFKFDSQADVPLIIMNVSGDSLEKPFYRIDSKLYDSTNIVVLEWKIPWQRIGLDTSGNYAFQLKGESGCGDSLPALLITGSKEKPQGIITATLIIRGILIIVLLVIYVIVSIRMRNRTHQKGSPRQ
jgi:hypothetical protein